MILNNDEAVKFCDEHSQAFTDFKRAFFDPAYSEEDYVYYFCRNHDIDIAYDRRVLGSMPYDKVFYVNGKSTLCHATGDEVLLYRNGKPEWHDSYTVNDKEEI